MARVSSCGNKRETRVSHKATNWVLALRGLKPAPKMLLFYLADRHNPDYGCFPMQATLAIDTEMSVASINTHLNALEDAGLIRRVKRVDRKTESSCQPATSWVSRKASPQNRVQILETDRTERLGNNCKATTRRMRRKRRWITLWITLWATEKPTPNYRQSRPRKRGIPTQNLETNPVREPIIEPVKRGGGARAR